MSWETVIGLEIHVQLSTNSKLFSGGSTEFGAEANTHVDLIDMGLPGVLPVANKEAFYKAIRFGLATDAKINQTSSFDRKNYFYPDLPKGYQITQMIKPIVEKGSIKINLDGSEKIINITFYNNRFFSNHIYWWRDNQSWEWIYLFRKYGRLIIISR